MPASQPSPFLPHLPADRLEKLYRQAASNEFDRKMQSPESSAALVANTFGLFIDGGKQLLPPLPGTEGMGWPAQRVTLEEELRFPWNGGRHPWLDVFIETSTHLIGVESKRYEPYRTPKHAEMSEAYWRPDSPGKVLHR